MQILFQSPKNFAPKIRPIFQKLIAGIVSNPRSVFSEESVSNSKNIWENAVSTDRNGNKIKAERRDDLVKNPANNKGDLPTRGVHKQTDSNLKNSIASRQKNLKKLQSEVRELSKFSAAFSDVVPEKCKKIQVEYDNLMNFVTNLFLQLWETDLEGGEKIYEIPHNQEISSGRLVSIDNQIAEGKEKFTVFKKYCDEVALIFIRDKLLEMSDGLNRKFSQLSKEILEIRKALSSLKESVENIPKDLKLLIHSKEEVDYKCMLFSVGLHLQNWEERYDQLEKNGDKIYRDTYTLKKNYRSGLAKSTLRMQLSLQKFSQQLDHFGRLVEVGKQKIQELTKGGADLRKKLDDKKRHKFRWENLKKMRRSLQGTIRRVLSVGCTIQ